MRIKDFLEKEDVLLFKNEISYNKDKNNFTINGSLYGPIFRKNSAIFLFIEYKEIDENFVYLISLYEPIDSNKIKRYKIVIFEYPEEVMTYLNNLKTDTIDRDFKIVKINDKILNACNNAKKSTDIGVYSLLCYNSFRDRSYFKVDTKHLTINHCCPIYNDFKEGNFYNPYHKEFHTLSKDMFGKVTYKVLNAKGSIIHEKMFSMKTMLTIGREVLYFELKQKSLE